MLPAILLSHPAPPSADLVLTNGNIYTVADQMPHASALAVRKGKIIFVGSNAGAAKFIGAQTKRIDLQGLTVVPGLTDSHYHLAGVGEREVTLNLEGTTSLQDFLQKVKTRVDAAKRGAWVTGRGWMETFWTPQEFPTRYDLDKVSPDNPVFLTRGDGHGAVANSKALELAGITKDTANPFGGEIVRDSKTGEPTGMLLDNAHGLIERLIPATTVDELQHALQLGVERSLKLGWCEVHIPGNSWAEKDAIRDLYRRGKIKMRIYDAISVNEAQRLFSHGTSKGEFDNHFTMRSIKIYADGALGSRGAALLKPYSDAPTSGFLTAKEAEVLPILRSALRNGVQVMFHAIGDKGNRTVLDWYEKAMRSVPRNEWKVKDPRWRIEHSQNVDPADVPRFKNLGVIPSMQPSHAISDLHFAPKRLGMERLANAYAWKRFLNQGSIICGGSDAPVERGEPMIEFYAAVARRDLKGFSGPGWHPEQAVTRLEALKMFTEWAAYAAFEEREKGTIEVGKLADFTVLSADIMKIPFQLIPKTTCKMALVGGEVVYDGR